MEMKESLIIHICWVLVSILLVLPSAKCLSLQQLDKRDIPEDSRGVDGANNSQPYAGDLLPVEMEIYNMSSLVTSPNSVLTEESQDSTRLLSNSTVTDMGPETDAVDLVIQLGPTGQAKTSSETRILTTAGSTVVYISSGSFASDPTKGGSQESYQPTVNNNTGLNQSNMENASQVNTVEMITANPKTSIFETNGEFTVSSHLDDQPLASVTAETLLMSETPMAPVTTTFANKNNSISDFTIPQITEDWDDTKVTAQSTKKLGDIDVTSSIPDQFMVTGNSHTILPTSPRVAVPSDDQFVSSVFVTVTEKGFLNDSSELNSTQIPDLVIETTQSQELSSTYTESVTEQPSEPSDTGTAAVLSVTSHDISLDPEGTGNADGTALDSITAPTEDSSKDTSPLQSTTGQVLLHEVPTTEDLNLPSGDEFLAGSVSPVMPVVTTQAEDTTLLTTVTSASHVSVVVPPTRRITTTEPHGMDKIKSEEGEEEDEEHEDDDDDEEMDEDDDEEEEDDDDDKTTDSAGDSSDNDSDFPHFTHPGLSSQEPLEDDGNAALIDGAAYQVPNAMEWEQQNQGLVKSWMEKLKDKAGYMSGMLIPVGVGIAGALFILGVLYSIKIMNRRRRNGFKRHKRKQREFNSMQDRVMLLADSSEDEF